MDAKFRTVVNIPEFRFKTGYNHLNMFLGSCFTENIGAKMTELKYPVDLNPFGILYNPASVAESLRILMDGKSFSEADLFQQEGLWHSLLHHSRFSGVNMEETLGKINNRIKTSSEYLKNAGFLFITFGTAWIYRFKNTGQIVSNCHKLPASDFIRIRLSVDEIVADYKNLAEKLKAFNPNLKVLFTVSPVRHWRDGATENQRSKAILHLAVEQIIKNTDGFCSYFPAYELVMDELRDYRFYTPDMIHISDVAVDFIWEKFEEALIDADSRQISVKVRKLKQALNHRPFNKNTEEYRSFVSQTIEQILKLENEFKNIDFTEEKMYFFRSEK